MAEGRIKWYSPELGHGFILCEVPLSQTVLEGVVSEIS